MDFQDQINELFPDCSELVKDIEPLDGRVLLQMQCVSNKVGKILLTESTKKEFQYSKKLSKVVKKGEHAFYDTRSGRKWIDINTGDYVISPNIAGRVINFKHPHKEDTTILFVVVDDVHVELKVANPIDYLKNLV
jgi:co-chaperonin GroES (HSP10)